MVALRVKRPAFLAGLFRAGHFFIESLFGVAA
jgi:hypothetical protein